ncbi:MAG: efflux RND transporter periplasmic adaptor subunit [Elusimicrobiota bacterium]|jgi:multidrug efflux pump subunit AcrA (membrane-fusion protein)|nr:efflux RND transporter periplasmic adaptor subunit [Elusimicrobiota bacterium]
MKKVIILLSAAVLITACGKKHGETALEKVETDRFSVQTEKVEKRDISQELLLTGSVKAWEEAVIFPRVDGKLFKNVLDEGDPVKRNQTIALIDRDEVGAVYEPVVVPSTLTGIVGKTYLDPGANVTKTTAIALVVNQGDVRILVDIPERYIGKIRLNQKATFTIEAYGDEEFEATVYKLSPVVDAKSRMVSAELKAANKNNLIKSGMFAKVKLILEEDFNVPSVSLPCVMEETDENGNTNTFVFVVNPDETVSKTLVKAGIKSFTYQAIDGGLNEGEEVAKIIFGLKDGSKIKVENK